MGEKQTPEKPRSEGAVKEDVAPRGADDTMRWVRRGSVVLVLLIGWLFILVTNHFRITPPVVFVCLGYFAAVCAIYTLYRTGATAVTETDEADDAMSWDKPLGALDELEREKRALLKAIKEAEFDHQMGKLSKSDADNMINIYRTRAIEVIKEIDRLSGGAGTIRDQIEREVKARLELEAKAKHAAGGAAAKASNVKAAKAAKKNKKAPAAAAKDAAVAAEKAAAAATAAASPTKEPGADEAADAAADDAASAAEEAKEAAAEAQEAAASVEEPPPTAEATPAKEATP